MKEMQARERRWKRGGERIEGHRMELQGHVPPPVLLIAGNVYKARAHKLHGNAHKYTSRVLEECGTTSCFQKRGGGVERTKRVRRG